MRLAMAAATLHFSLYAIDNYEQSSVVWQRVLRAQLPVPPRPCDTHLEQTAGPAGGETKGPVTEADPQAIDAQAERRRGRLVRPPHGEGGAARWVA